MRTRWWLAITIGHPLLIWGALELPIPVALCVDLFDVEIHRASMCHDDSRSTRVGLVDPHPVVAVR